MKGDGTRVRQGCGGLARSVSRSLLLNTTLVIALGTLTAVVTHIPFCLAFALVPVTGKRWACC
jgi:hypothetical protein